MLCCLTIVFCSQCFAYAVAFLTDFVVAVALPECIYYGVFVLPVAGRTEDFRGVLIGVVAVTVAAEFFRVFVFHVRLPRYVSAGMKLV